MHPLTSRRALAYLEDCLRFLGLAALMVPLGLAVRHHGRPARTTVVGLSALPPVAATVIAAVQESRRGTPGHRRARLLVLDRQGAPPGLARALLRNTVKIGLPWQLGHLVGVGAAYGGFERRDPWTLVPTALVYPWFAAVAAGVATGSGQALHDRVAGTQVVDG
jgi:uncharacterized RDD family membrane protein YckC